MLNAANIMNATVAAMGLGYDSRAIANRILDIAQRKGRSLTIMQLVKLIYFAQGWYLAFTDRPLTSNSAQAWQYGPVYPLVYKVYSGAGSRPITGPILNKSTGEPYKADLSEEEEDLLEWIVDEYGAMHAFDLSKQTHADDGPWKAVVDSSGYYSEIPNSLLKAYFKKFVVE